MAIYRHNEPEWVRDLRPSPEPVLRRDPIMPVRPAGRPECDTCDREMNRGSVFTTCSECRRRAKLRAARSAPQNGAGRARRGLHT